MQRRNNRNVRRRVIPYEINGETPDSILCSVSHTERYDVVQRYPHCVATLDDRRQSETAASGNRTGVDFRDALMPLSLATRAVHAAVYPHAALETSRLLGIAHVMAALIPMYAYHPSDGQELRRVTAEELLRGFFRQDSHELHFTDGRAAVVDVAVESAAVTEVIAMLRDAAATGYIARYSSNVSAHQSK